MNAPAVSPARLEFNDQGLPFSAEYGDIYHPLSGPFVQADHVFLQGNGLPGRWQGRDRFVVLETGFGLGNNFLAVWDAWRRDPPRCARLHFLSFERHPLTRDDLQRAHADSPLPQLAKALIDAWPPLTPNLHRLAFDDAAVQLHLHLGDATEGVRQCVTAVDAFFLDGFAPARNPDVWNERLMKSLARLAAPGATLATWTAARAVREGLASAGFEVRLAPGQGGKRDITHATFAPRFERRHAPSRGHPTFGPHKRALIVGAGLAGCATAWALAEQGWESTLIERHSAPASEASGNPGGLFHGIVNAQDGLHARFNRAAALEAQRVVARAVSKHGVAGACDGLLRLTIAADPAQAAHEMRAALAHLGLPADYVQALDAHEAGAVCGLPLKHAAWFYPGGGWVDPAGLCRAYLERAGTRARFIGETTVHALHRSANGWQLHDAAGRVIDEAATLVLANAGDALRLLGSPEWTVGPVRGQISIADAVTAGVPLPRVPLSGAGYMLPLVDGQLMFGSTSQPGDLDPAVRTSDHAANLSRLATLCDGPISLPPENLRGRVGWRWASHDRLPIIGAVPTVAAGSERGRLEQPRFVPREAGLYVCVALGSRGITWSALGAQVLAAAICGAPSPVEADLLDAIDPARFVSRAIRRHDAS